MHKRRNMLNSDQKVLARSLRKRLTGNVPQEILDNLSDEELLHQYDLKRVADLKKFNEKKGAK
jgi:hypothetical protein